MSHGAALKQAYATDRKPERGDKVSFYNMCLPCNEGPGPGPHRATVIAVNQDGSLHLAVRRHKEAVRDERFVSHRAMADGPRFWDWR